MDMAYEHTFGTQCPRCLQAWHSMLEGMQAYTSTGEDPANVCSMGARGVPPFGVPSMGSGMHDLGYAHPGPRTSGRGGAARHNAEGSFMAENPCKRRRLHILPRVAPSGLRGVPDWSLRTGPDSRGSLVLVVLVRAHAREGPSRPDHPLGASVAPARSSGWCRTSGSKTGAMPGPAAPRGPLRRENGRNRPFSSPKWGIFAQIVSQTPQFCRYLV